jgi:hypothetical protein
MHSGAGIGGLSFGQPVGRARQSAPSDVAPRPSSGSLECGGSSSLPSLPKAGACSRTPDKPLPQVESAYCRSIRIWSLILARPPLQ